MQCNNSRRKEAALWIIAFPASGMRSPFFLYTFFRRDQELAVPSGFKTHNSSVRTIRAVYISCCHHSTFRAQRDTSMSPSFKTLLPLQSIMAVHRLTRSEVRVRIPVEWRGSLEENSRTSKSECRASCVCQYGRDRMMPHCYLVLLGKATLLFVKLN